MYNHIKGREMVRRNKTQMDKETARTDWSGSEKEKIFKESGEEAR